MPLQHAQLGQASHAHHQPCLQGFYLDLKLFASRGPALDLVQLGAVATLGVAEVSLSAIAGGRGGDLSRAQVPLVREETGERVGVVTITLLAQAALRALPRPGAPGTQQNPMAQAQGRAPGVGSSMQSVGMVQPGYGYY